MCVCDLCVRLCVVCVIFCVLWCICVCGVCVCVCFTHLYQNKQKVSEIISEIYFSDSKFLFRVPYTCINSSPQLLSRYNIIWQNIDL